jgi:formylmethanofuran dehydrogenase subunit E
LDYLSERVAYLKGLAEGMKIDESSNEGKLLKNVVDVLADFAEAIDDLKDSQVEMSEHVENIDEDLAQLEYEVYDDDDYEENEDFEEVDYFEIECPNCHETVYLDEDMLDDEEEIICPNCKEPIEIEFECDCGHNEHNHND